MKPPSIYSKLTNLRNKKFIMIDLMYFMEGRGQSGRNYGNVQTSKG